MAVDPAREAPVTETKAASGPTKTAGGLGPAAFALAFEVGPTFPVVSYVECSRVSAFLVLAPP